jgi:hypothetical protein
MFLVTMIFQAFWLKTDFNKWKDEDESDDDMDKNIDLAEVNTLHGSYLICIIYSLLTRFSEGKNCL